MRFLLRLQAIIFLLLSLRGMAQPYYFRHYQVEDGLSNNTVICMAQDRDGFMWFGTKEGLNRFDGYHFRSFQLDEDYERSLTKDLINSIFVDRQQVMWVGAQKGLYRYEPEKERFVQFIDTLRNVSNIVMDRRGRLWFIADHTLCYYSFLTHRLQRFPAEQYFSANTLCLSEDGDIWIGTTGGLLQHYDQATQTFRGYNIFSHSPPVTTCFIEKLIPAGPQSIFIGTSCQGVKRFDIATRTYQDILTYNPDKTTIYVRSMLRYSEAEYWFGTESGIFILNTRSGEVTNLKKKFLDPYSLSDNAIYSLYRDREGNMWVGTFFGGVNYYAHQPLLFKKYYPNYSSNSISGSAVREICQDNDGNIWIGTEDAGLNKLYPASGKIVHFEPGRQPGDISYSNIHGLAVAGNDLWIGTHEHGLDVLDIRTGKVRRHYAAGRGPNDLKSDFIPSLLCTADGRIFAGTGNGLYEYQPDTDGFKRVPEIPGGVMISCLFEDRRQTIWAGTHSNGVFYFNRRTGASGRLVNDRNNRNSLSTDYINAITGDHAGNLWIATEGGGLCQLSPDRRRITRFTTRNGLPSNYIFKVVEDDDGQLWVSTSKGLVNFDPTGRRMYVYTKSNGLLSDHFNYNSGFRDANGTLYFGSIRGLVTFRPCDRVRRLLQPPVYITGLQVDNREVSALRDSTLLPTSIVYADKVTLPYDRSSISLDFAALSYVSPDMTAYSYMMEGIEKTWTTVQPNRKVYYTSLPPGEYTFKVKAAVNGVAGQPARELVIQVLPPFWASPLAYLLYVLLVLLAGYYIVRSYHRRTQKKKEKEAYEAKIDFFTNVAHEIRTPLTLIKGPLENLMERADELPGFKADIQMMERNTNRLVGLISHILNFRQIEARGYSLDFGRVNVKALLQQSCEDFAIPAEKKGLDYQVDLPPSSIYAIADEEALERIFSNLLSNAVKYADRLVTVKLHPVMKDDSYFTVEFLNDGPVISPDMREKIFQPFVRLKETARQKGTGIGLTMARSLAELHNGILYIRNTETVNVFVLHIPLKTE